jgi:predicted esterase YcpF (UPF0227 family)
MNTPSAFLAVYQQTITAIAKRYKPGLLDYSELHLTSLYSTMLNTQTMVMAVLDNPEKYPEINIKKYQELLRKWYSQYAELSALYAKATTSDKQEALEIELGRLSLSS